MKQTETVAHRRESLRARRRRMRRRRLIMLWCRRTIFLTSLGCIICLFLFIVNVFKSQAQDSAEVEVVPLTTMVEACVMEPKFSPMVESDTHYSTITINETTETPTPTMATVTPKITETELVTEPLEPQISAYEPGETYFYNFTEQEKKYIAKVVYREARGECFEGQVAVAAVVINRYYSDDPFFTNDSIYSIVTQNLQFADIEGVTDSMLADYPDCMRAVEQACLGWDPTRKLFEEGACYFYDPEGVTGYQKQIRTGIEELPIGGHCFHNEFND